MIYLIQDSRDRVKIGFTDQTMKKRLSALKTGSADDLSVMATFEGDRKKEKMIHKLLSCNRVNREWFYGGCRDYWFWNVVTMMQMDGAKILDVDCSEIGNFIFIPELAKKGVPVMNMKAIMK